ncbi:DUF2795 domain-containing protein [Frankia sp. QA3]|uniref:DUF2795 domain-containing protein n=1 Tax=Frankia sp. QA3 TaxID=710111 RepID=UPI000269C626|nr:DUF2795 domain-containing protein [Frankia sp. QA3]EIV94454.1 Protein of unknown function (DUF2795) [Frankia sp. QA3]
MAVDRGSSKHGPWRDDAMAHEVSGFVRSGRDTRAEEWRSVEPADELPGDAQFPDPAQFRAGASAGMTPTDVEERSELARWLGRAVFPAEREEIMDHLRHQHAPDRVVEAVAAAPPGVQFTSVGELWRMLRSRSDAELPRR